MRTLIKDFDDDVYARENSGNIDPLYLAADICQDFVVIHHFSDGNSYMCRLPLGAYLTKYSGVMLNVGEHGAQRSGCIPDVREAGNTDEDIA